MTKQPDAADEWLRALKAELIALSQTAVDDRKPVGLDPQSVGPLSRQDSLHVQAMAKGDAVNAGRR